MPGEWPLTGRTEELSRISGLTRRRDGPAGVVVAGPAGVGKTRLAREVLAAAQRRGTLTWWAAATASAQRRVASVVLTLRSGERAPDAVTALWKDGHLVRVDLQPLSEAQTATLVEAVLGGPVDGVTARRLWVITRGNALYLRQLVDGEMEASRLHQVTGVWRWSGELALSPGLIELVSARIGQLPDAQRAVIEVLAFSEPLGVTLLADLTDAEAVEQVEARGLVEVYPDDRRLQARLAHPLYGEVQRTQMGRLHARRLRGRIAQALAATGGRRAGDTLRRAVLTLGSDLQPDPVLLTDAARRATELGDLALAVRIARARWPPVAVSSHGCCWVTRWVEQAAAPKPTLSWPSWILWRAPTPSEPRPRSPGWPIWPLSLAGSPRPTGCSTPSRAPSPMTSPGWSWSGRGRSSAPSLAALSRRLTWPPRC